MIRATVLRNYPKDSCNPGDTRHRLMKTSSLKHTDDFVQARSGENSVEWIEFRAGAVFYGKSFENTEGEQRAPTLWMVFVIFVDHCDRLFHRNIFGNAVR